MNLYSELDEIRKKLENSSKNLDSYASNKLFGKTLKKLKIKSNLRRKIKQYSKNLEKLAKDPSISSLSEIYKEFKEEMPTLPVLENLTNEERELIENYNALKIIILEDLEKFYEKLKEKEALNQIYA